MTLLKLAAVMALAGLLTVPPAAGRAATIQATVVASRVALPRPPASRAGDVERVVWSVRDRFGRTIGLGLLDCRWVVRRARMCVGTINLPLGRISVLGSSSTRELGAFGVVGGTGRYAGAQGELVFRSIGLRKLVISMTV